MTRRLRHYRKLLSLAACAFFLLSTMAGAQTRRAESSSKGVPFSELVAAIRGRAKSLESSTGMRLAFASFTAEYKLSPASVNYSDFVVVRLVYEAARDAGFWNMHWDITNMPPNSDSVWRQWRGVVSPSFTMPTATAECDEVSALYAFLVERVGVHGVGLFWPYPNHTVAVWSLHPASSPPVRVVIPTSQIFLEESDDFGTHKFNPWKQKTIYEYTRRDVPDTFQIPRPLYDFFAAQMEKYAGATNETLQRLRYLREAVFLKTWSPETAANEALRYRTSIAHAAPEDIRALESLAQDMRQK